MRIGLIGFGFIGAAIYARANDGVDGVEIAFVHNRSIERLKDLPGSIVLEDLSDAASRSPDLIVEVAGPDVTRAHGPALVRVASYMPLSLTALVDDGLRDDLARAAALSGHSVFVAHGALVGMDSLLEWRDHWDQVSISFRKPPASLGLPGSLSESRVFEGSVREIAALFPHNVNAMVACALATLGLERCRGRIVADPAIDHLELAIEAIGRDGSRLNVARKQPARGVSGSEMAESVYRSILRAGGLSAPIDFV
jgi:aspartate dehydrogenase